MNSLKVLTIGLILACAAGCATTQSSRFYALSPLPESTASVTSKSAFKDIQIGIAPIKVPDYLDRSQMVIRDDPNELTLLEFDRWAGRLDQSMANILSENLSLLLSTDKIRIYPWKGSVDYLVDVEVIQFDGAPGKSATLIGRWTILGRAGMDVLNMKRYSITEPTGSNGYKGLVAAQSRALGRLSQEIAEAVSAIPK